MSDMTSVIVPKSDQQNSDDFIAGPRTITITSVKITPGEQPCSIFFEGDEGKPYKCCKSMARVLVQLWGADASKYVGRSMTLYRDPKVTWGGMAVGGIRISHMSNIDNTATMMLTATKGSRKPFVVQPLTASNTDTKRDTPADIDIAALRKTAEIYADRGDQALTDYLGTLSKAQKDALRPYGTELRARAQAVGQKPATDAGARDGGQSDKPPAYQLSKTPDNMLTYANESDYLFSYEEVVELMWTAGNTAGLAKFDERNGPLIAQHDGLADAVAVVNGRVRV